MNLKQLAAQATNPETDPTRLQELAAFGEGKGLARAPLYRPIERAARRNPNLPGSALADYIDAGDLDAWANPSLDFALLTGEVEQVDLEMGSFNALAAWSTEPRPDLLEALRERLLAAVDARWKQVQAVDLVDILNEQIGANDLHTAAHRRIVRLILLPARTMLAYRRNTPANEIALLEWLESWTHGTRRGAQKTLEAKKHDALYAALQTKFWGWPLAYAYGYALEGGRVAMPHIPINAMVKGLREHGVSAAQVAEEANKIADQIRAEIPEHPLVRLVRQAHP